MSGRPQWSYVQARLQARHGERLQEFDWRAIEAARSFDQYIERARASPLRRFAEHMNPRLSSHVAERTLRDTWRAYVAEVANWVPSAWRQAVIWTSYLPELPIIDAVLKGEVPKWVQQDPPLAALIQVNVKRSAALPKSPPDALVLSGTAEKTLVARWHSHWCALWPHLHMADRRALLKLTMTISAHVEQLDRADPRDTSAPYRHALALKLVRLFRKHGGSPAAVFCHLALVALDLERLRGGLIQRRLFAPGNAKEAA